MLIRLLGLKTVASELLLATAMLRRLAQGSWVTLQAPVGWRRVIQRPRSDLAAVVVTLPWRQTVSILQVAGCRSAARSAVCASVLTAAG